MDLLDLHEQHLGRGAARLARLMGAPVIRRMEGNYAYSDQGQQFLSCSGYGTFLLGHQLPEIVESVIEQLHSMSLTGPFVLHEGQALAAKDLTDICPDGMDYVQFVNSGSEATEAALKLAWLAGRRRLISTLGGFHGTTLGALGVTGQEALRQPFDALLPRATFVPFDDPAALDEVLGPDACLIIEPVQGEAGARVPREDYLAEVARQCTDSGTLLIVDEVQTGLGRLGAMWGSTAAGIRPDILLSGKALGGGVVPVAAVVATEEIFRPFSRDPTLHTTTNGGSPLACAAVRATIDAVQRYDVPARARALGERILDMLRLVFQARCPELVRDVRGRGLLLGIEFVDPADAGELTLELLNRSVLVGFSALAHGTVRLSPSAFFSDEDIGWLRQAMEGAADALAARCPRSAP